MIELTGNDIRKAESILHEMKTDGNASPSSYTHCLENIRVIADRYKIDTQDIANLIQFPKKSI